MVVVDCVIVFVYYMFKVVGVEVIVDWVCGVSVLINVVCLVMVFKG